SMKGDPLLDAARALREQAALSPARADETRARVLASVRKQRARRLLFVKTAIPLAAVLVGSIAWAAATGRLPSSFAAGLPAAPPGPLPPSDPPPRPASNPRAPRSSEVAPPAPAIPSPPATSSEPENEPPPAPATRPVSREIQPSKVSTLAPSAPAVVA